MAWQFFVHNYPDWKTLVQRFQPEVPDVYYWDHPYSGTGAASANFNAWAINYARGIVFILFIEEDFSGSFGTPTDVKPVSFAVDFPQAIALQDNPSLTFFS